MKNIIHTTRTFLFSSLVLFSFIVCVATAHAGSTPSLSLVNNTSTVGIQVTGADAHATVMFYFPSGTVSNSTSVTYSSIDIGTTDSNGSFSVTVAPNSYGLSGGSSVYVSVDGINSAVNNWPATVTSSGQSGSLS